MKKLLPLAALRRALPGLSVTRRRHPDGSPFLAVANPHPVGLPIRIDLGDAPALHFGPHHDHYDLTPDGWRDLLAHARQIVDGARLVGTFFNPGAAWKSHAFLDPRDLPLTDADAFRLFVDRQWNPMTGEILARAARVGAVLETAAWDPAQNRRFALAPDWFQTVVRPTALDYLLAAAEAQTLPGGSLLESFTFECGDDTLQALLDGSRWLLRPAPWTCPPRQRRPLASAPSLPALLDAPLPLLLTAGRRPAAPAAPTPTTLRAHLASLPTWDIAIDRARGEDDTPWTVETPLDPIGLCGLLDDWAKCPAHYRAVVLRPDEAPAVQPFLAEINDRLGARIDLAASPNILPSRLVPAALAILRSGIARRRSPARRAAAAKLLPVFESADALRMPVSFRFA